MTLKEAANKYYLHVKETYYSGGELSDLEVIEAFIQGAKWYKDYSNKINKETKL